MQEDDDHSMMAGAPWRHWASYRGWSVTHKGVQFPAFAVIDPLARHIEIQCRIHQKSHTADKFMHRIEDFLDKIPNNVQNMKTKE
jgi:hypothetical protein